MLNGIELAAIVAVDREWGIGKGGCLPWRLPGDLAYFKEKTLGHAVVMGRRTFESLPGGALPGRVNIVMTRQAGYEPKGALVVRSVDGLAEAAKGICACAEAEKHENGGAAASGGCAPNSESGGRCSASGGRKLFVCGGAEIYRLLLPYTDRLLITKVDTVCGADTFFPNIEAQGSYKKSGESEDATESGLTYRFTEYAR
jgi:dihydrofolate reductase